jgi:hypothetical protein
VYELGIPAHGDHLDPEIPELIVPLCQSGKLGRSDKGEVGWIVEENRPFLCCFQLLQTDLPEIALDRIEHLKLKIRDFLADAQTATYLRHISSLLAWNEVMYSWNSIALFSSLVIIGVRSLMLIFYFPSIISRDTIPQPSFLSAASTW